jgi:hypothetical protein
MPLSLLELGLAFRTILLPVIHFLGIFFFCPSDFPLRLTRRAHVLRHWAGQGMRKSPGYSRHPANGGVLGYRSPIGVLRTQSSAQPCASPLTNPAISLNVQPASGMHLMCRKGTLPGGRRGGVASWKQDGSHKLGRRCTCHGQRPCRGHMNGPTIAGTRPPGCATGASGPCRIRAGLDVERVTRMKGRRMR